MHMLTRAYTHIHTYKQKHTHTCIHTDTHICTHAHTHAHKHMYANTCTHTGGPSSNRSTTSGEEGAMEGGEFVALDDVYKVRPCACVRV